MWTDFSRRLLDWYAAAARDLPWRRRPIPPTPGQSGARQLLHPDPYAVLVSEIMLQQTRVETVLPYFQRWLERFPTLQALAAADMQDVLNAWEGLGYYSRARNLHRLARLVVTEQSGRLPETVAELRRLPGVGPYTAGAIASIAFGQDAAALDGNIRRVLARVFNLILPARSKEGEAQLWAWAAENLPPGYGGDYNQAIMDLGAQICLPRDPVCQRCPVNELCQANLLGVQNERPILEARPETPHYLVTGAIIQRNGQVLIARRPETGLLGGLWEFPGGKVKDGEDLPTCLRREIQEELGVEVQVGEHFGVYRHGYTHFKVTLHAFRCTLSGEEPQPLHATALAWVDPAQLDNYPMGKIDRRISSDLVSRQQQLF